MIAAIRKHLQTTPFRPFVVRLTNGSQYPVPTVGHIYLPPSGARVVGCTSGANDQKPGA